MHISRQETKKFLYIVAGKYDRWGLPNLRQALATASQDRELRKKYLRFQGPLRTLMDYLEKREANDGTRTFGISESEIENILNKSDSRFFCSILAVKKFFKRGCFAF